MNNTKAQPTKTNCTNITVATSSPKQASTSTLTIVPRDDTAYIPTMATDNAAGYDLHANHHSTIPPNEIAVIDTGISIIPPQGTYARIASRSGLAIKHKVDTKAGVIDPDYTGTIRILLHNFGQNDYHVRKGDRIAQMILEQYTHAPIKIENSTPDTTRGSSGFGSTGKHGYTTCNTLNTILTPDIDLVTTKPEFTMNITIKITKNHPQLGLILKNTQDGVQIISCEKSTPSAKIPQWRQTIKNGYVRKVNNTNITTKEEFTQAIKVAIQNKQNTIQICIATNEPIDIHPETGIPQMHFDQLGQIDSILHSLKHNEEIPYISVDDAPPLDNAVKVHKLSRNSLTRTKLKKQKDWDEWIESERLQLDLYAQQNMFSEPTTLPSDMTGVNILPMIWTYLIKSCGRKKARCVANGAPHLKGSITLANTYAACLEQNGARIFWSIAAITNKKVFGSDASNTFAEAPPPQAPLYLRVDQAYIDWYHHKTGKTLSPDTYVRVQHAIQGHPEAPRLWQDHFDKILHGISFQPTTQEPCFYLLKSKEFNEDIYLLRQVDDLAIACSNAETGEHYWKAIDSHLKAKFKCKGLLAQHNGIDII